MRPRIVMIFLDGVGIGKSDPVQNPFFALSMSNLYGLLGGSIPSTRNARIESPLASLVPLNATLGVPGLPQSGTGQTALFTGFNAPSFVGKHFGPYPYSTLKPVIREQNIFRRLLERGRRVFYANAYPRQYFDYIRAHPHRSRVTTTVLSWTSTGLDLNDSTSLLAGKSVSSDMTNAHWPGLGYPDMPRLSEREAGSRLAGFLEVYDFVLYEYFYTDHAGHHQSMDEAKTVLRSVDELLAGILDAFDHRSMLLILTSDHGNLEDLSTKAHTRNPVPLLAVGAGHRSFVSRCSSLTDVVPSIMKVMA